MKPIIVLLNVAILAISTNSVQSKTNLGKSSQAFSFDFFKEISKRDGNKIFSPFSILSAYGMLLKGAKKETAKELKKVFYWSDDVHKHFKKILDEYQHLKSRNLTIFNGNLMVLNPSFKINNNTIEDVMQYYRSNVINSVKFDEILMRRINEWASLNTNNKINEIMSSVPDDQKVMILYNLLYFKAEWLYKFNSNLNRKYKFYNQNGSISFVEYMTNETSYRYQHFPEKGFRMIELPYVGEFSLYILHPDMRYGDNLNQIIEKMSLKDISEAIDSLEDEYIELRLPKFKLYSEFNLHDILPELGLELPFNEYADLSGFGEVPGKIYVEKSVHKALIEVNELGTEAGAFTSVEINFRFNPLYTQFWINSPFAFFIKDKLNDLILFAGCVTNLS